MRYNTQHFTFEEERSKIKLIKPRKQNIEKAMIVVIEKHVFWTTRGFKKKTLDSECWVRYRGENNFYVLCAPLSRGSTERGNICIDCKK